MTNTRIRLTPAGELLLVALFYFCIFCSLLFAVGGAGIFPERRLTFAAIGAVFLTVACVVNYLFERWVKKPREKSSASE